MSDETIGELFDRLPVDVWVTEHGMRLKRVPQPGEGMTFPARCTHCGGVYDLAKVTVTARYADCSMWNAPCCGLQVDDRGDTGWKSRKDYERIER